MNADQRARNQILKKHILSLADAASWEETERLSRASITDIFAERQFRDVTTVLVVGHGTSFATSQLVAHWMRAISRVEATAVYPFMLAHYPDTYLLAPESTLVIGISCSGSTASVIGALQAGKDAGAQTLLISGRQDCEGATVASSRIVTCADIEKSVDVSAYSVSHLFMALAGLQLAGELARTRGGRAAEQAARIAGGTRGFRDALASLPGVFDAVGKVVDDLGMDPTRPICVLGTGPNVGTATEGALKISEFAWLFGAAEELEDFAHGRFREVGSREVVLVIAPCGPSIAKTKDILAGAQVSGTPTVVLTDSTDKAIHALATHVVSLPAMSDELLTPFLYIFPLWFFGWHVRNNEGELVGEKRHGLYAVDINFERHFHSDGTRRSA
jgi:fructoselysine-6-P-deglycase FrlB-like protein